MKSKLTIIVVMLLLSIWSFSSNAQTAIPTGKAQLIEFTNATAKFTVPEGKTWYITNVFSSLKNAAGDFNIITLKKINEINFGDGPALSNYVRNYISYPIILPSKTTFEISITDNTAKAIITYTEVDN